jgi:CHASE2 domain-containing sensor protein
MAKLVVLKLDGDLQHQGFRVTLEIGTDFARPEIEICGNLPPEPELARCIHQWELKYRSLGMTSRIKPQEIVYDGFIQKRFECSHISRVLSDRLQRWLSSEGFRSISNTLREELRRDEIIRVLIRTDNSELQKLPWHLWDFFYKYPLAEFAITATSSQAPPKPPRKAKVRILAIIGNSTGINTERDQQLLKNLPNAETVLLLEPQRQELNTYLWQQWDILFFAGHSETTNDTGRIYINKADALTIEELKYGLDRAISLGLQLAIFNSCDGLGLARQLANQNIPQMVIMREPVPDEVAQEYLKHFLVAYAGGKSLYVASREAREKLEGLQDKYPNATWLPIIFQNPAVVPPNWQDLFIEGIKTKRDFRNALIASVVITTLVIGVRYLGILQESELRAYDRFMQLRPGIERTDPRLLIITVDEADIRYQNQKGMSSRGSLSDEALQQLLQKLDKYKPTTIGLDIYRDFAVDSQYPDLANRLRNNERLFAVCKVDAASDGAAGGIYPPNEVPKHRQTFSDFTEDQDETLRRQLLQLTPSVESHCSADSAFNLQLARHYLQTKNITADINPQGYLQIGKVVFRPLEEHSSGYQKHDASGYQILLNYRSLRSSEKIADTVSLVDVLNDKIDRQPLQNRIALIGVTASSSTAADDYKMPLHRKRIPGVFIQAHSISQIISAVEDNRPLLWWWSGWMETFWIWGWSILGVVVVFCCKKPTQLGIAIASVLLTLFGICFVMFTQAGWIPLIPSAIALVLTATFAAWIIRRQNSNNTYIKRANVEINLSPLHK